MKKLISILLIFTSFLFSNKLEAEQSVSLSQSNAIQAEAAAASSYSATAMSMVFWGVVLVAGMAVAAILINSSSSH